MIIKRKVSDEINTNLNKIGSTIDKLKGYKNYGQKTGISFLPGNNTKLFTDR